MDGWYRERIQQDYLRMRVESILVTNPLLQTIQEVNFISYERFAKHSLKHKVLLPLSF